MPEETAAVMPVRLAGKLSASREPSLDADVLLSKETAELVRAYTDRRPGSPAAHAGFPADGEREHRPGRRAAQAGIRGDGNEDKRTPRKRDPAAWKWRSR